MSGRRALQALHRVLGPRGRLIFESRDPADRRWITWNPDDSRRSIVLPDGSTISAWTTVTSVDGSIVSYVSHFRYPDGTELTSSATLRFRTEAELRTSLDRAGFDVDRIYGGWAREPVGLSADGELVVLAAVRPSTAA